MAQEQSITREEAEKQICELLDWVQGVHEQYSLRAGYLATATCKNQDEEKNSP